MEILKILNQGGIKFKYGNTMRVFPFTNPDIFAYKWEQLITNGLGYEIIAEKSLELEKISTEELKIQIHLGNMDLRVEERKSIGKEIIIHELLYSVLRLEETLRYDKIMRKFEKKSLLNKLKLIENNLDDFNKTNEKFVEEMKR